MAGMSRQQELEDLRAEETKLLGKLESYATKLMDADPRLSHGAAFAKASIDMKRTANAYSLLRERMIVAGLRPTLIR
jgi:hypothetical protein